MRKICRKKIRNVAVVCENRTDVLIDGNLNFGSGGGDRNHSAAQNQIDGNKLSAVIFNKKVFINGIEHKLPRSIFPNSVFISNGNIFVNGFKFKDGKLRRSLKAFLSQF